MRRPSYADTFRNTATAWLGDIQLAQASQFSVGSCSTFVCKARARERTSPVPAPPVANCNRIELSKAMRAALRSVAKMDG